MVDLLKDNFDRYRELKKKNYVTAVIKDYLIKENYSTIWDIIGK